MSHKINAMFSVIFIFLFAGCGTGMKTVYVDRPDKGPVYTAFSATDLHRIARKMTESLIERFDFESERPLVRVDGVKNKTAEHIDTKSITDSIIAKLVNSGKVRFAVDYAERDEHEKRAAEEAFDTRISEKDRQMYSGNQEAPKYRIYGELTGITNYTKDTKDVFYKFTLKLVDFRTGTLKWAEEEPIRKVGKKRLLGW